MAESIVNGEVNPRLTENTCDEPDASLMPLEDYQHSDLLPIEKATETIHSLFRTLPRDVWIAKNASKKPTDSLTSDESAAIHLYTMELKDQPLYSLLNQLLRDRDRRKLKPWFSYLKLFLTALFKLPPCSAKVVWRGVKKDLHSKYHRGEHYTWWAFSSCTLSLEVLEKPMYLGTTGERTLFSIECLNGKNIKPHSYYKTEDEILLLPGFYFEVVSKVAGGNGLHIIHLREVVPPFVLLEPPFHIQHSALPPSLTLSIESILEKIYEMNKDNDDMYKLFVVLPNPLFEWKSNKLFENEYILHFICECSTNEMHFTCYPGFSMPNPCVFFQIYGEYMKQFMIPLAQHLFDHQTTDQYHDTRFWSDYKTNLDKIVQVLDVTASESVTTAKAYETSTLKELLTSMRSLDVTLCRSMSVEMTVRWVCMNHYPGDQLNLIDELNSIEHVEVNINECSMVFSGKIDSAQISRLCDLFARGLRLFRINLSNLETSPSSLQQLTRALCRASLSNIYYCRYLSSASSDSEKLKIETVLKSCNNIIASNLQLKYVDMSVDGEHSRSNGGVIDALKSIRSLRSFSCGLNMNSEDIVQLMSLFGQNQILTTLELNEQTLTCMDVQRIAALIRSSRTLVNLKLWDSQIRDEGMQIVVDAICTNPVMKKLDVGNNELSDESAPVIIHLLQTCSSLTNLSVSWNKMTVMGARLIFEELETNRTLLHFNMGHNNLSVDHARKTTNYSGSIVGAGDLIGRMLLHNTTLCTLDIGSIEAPDQEIKPLADALIKNRTLAHLRLGESKYDSTSARQITDVLHWNCSLIGLNFSFGFLDERGIQKLDEILRKNDKLRYLDLYGCDLGNNEVSILAEGLKYNRALCCIDLRSNHLRKLSITTLTNVLRVNKHITYLGIGWNEIGDDGAKVIAQTLWDNRILTCIDMSYNEITDSGGQAMADALKSNSTLLGLSIISGNKLSSSILTKLRFIRGNLNVT